MRRVKPTPWFQDVKCRARFERGVRDAYDVATKPAGRGYGAKIAYRTKVEVPDFDDRTITVTMSNFYSPFLDHVIADGPTESPHRYGEHKLCMWRPKDPPERQWVWEDGLLRLITYARIHLYREAWWRERGEWLGDEASHGPLPEEESE